MFNVVHQKQPKTAAVSEDGVTIGPEFVAFSSIQKVLVNVPKKDKFIVKLVLKDKDYSLSFPTLTLRQEFNLSLQKHIANPPDNRQKVLAADPALRQLHADLVINGSLLSEDEFWVGREGLLEIYSPAEPPVLLKPTDKVTLTPEIIHSIFTLYPSVLKAYQDLVPTTLKETEFWSRYFSSKYLNPSSTLLDSYFDEEFKVKLQPEFRPDATMRPGSVAQAIPLVRKYNVTSQMSLAQAHKKTKLADASTTPKNLVISNANFYQPVAQDAEMVLYSNTGGCACSDFTSRFQNVTLDFRVPLMQAFKL